jgi:hypothetical protein
MKDQMIKTDCTKSVMILDCMARPRLALAEGAEGTKAICSGLHDILWFSEYVFEPEPGCPGPVTMKVTEVDAGKVTAADNCRFTVEISYHENYPAEKILNVIRRKTFCKFSLRQAGEDALSPD